MHVFSFLRHTMAAEKKSPFFIEYWKTFLPTGDSGIEPNYGFTKMITISDLSFFMLEEINMRVRHIGNNPAETVHGISFALRVVTLYTLLLLKKNRT